MIDSTLPGAIVIKSFSTSEEHNDKTNEMMKNYID